MMRFPSEEELKALREKYPAGTRIHLLEMYDDPHPVPPRTEGVVDFVDDAGGIHMKWENGSSLALCEEVDRYVILAPDYDCGGGSE